MEAAAIAYANKYDRARYINRGGGWKDTATRAVVYGSGGTLGFISGNVPGAVVGGHLALAAHDYLKPLQYGVSKKRKDDVKKVVWSKPVSMVPRYFKRSTFVR
jgi:hypothetical protein